MANNKTKQAKEALLTLLQNSEPLPLEVVYSRCNCDIEALTGALRSLIEKEEVRIGRLKTSPGWLIGNNSVNITAGGATWHTLRGQMRHSLPKIIRELRKYAPLPESCFEDGDDKKRFWRSDIEVLRKDNVGLRSLTLENELLSTPEAAAILGISTAQLRRLVDEGKLNLPFGSTRGSGVAMNKYSEITKQKKNLPVLELKQGDPQTQGLKRFPAKERPARRTEPSSVETGQLFLDNFQAEAVEALSAGLSVLVSAPTGNGKTLVAEILAKNLMETGQGIVYTSPLKALSNQKYRDFKELFGEEKVGLVTGDISINPDAPMLIMTTEIFRNWCLGEPEQMLKTAYVVFDEIHYLDDTERGTTWEESILFAPPHVKLLGLSATVPNINEIADWISTVRGEKVVVIEERKRFIPLDIHWIAPNGRIIEEKEARQEVEEIADLLKAHRNKKRWLKE
ncbi:MAG: DEAD/DEAH box helicase [Desulfotomaculaceae bacterium]|nr:DEAD/DEAH box helicase [Desulfotomaculaceae bacterium]